MTRTHSWALTVVLLFACRWATGAAFADVRTERPIRSARMSL